MTERAVMDIRIWVEGEDKLDVWARATELQRIAALFAPSGVQVRYLQLRDGSKTFDFDATMLPAKRTKRTRRTA